MSESTKVCRWCREDFEPVGRNHWAQVYCSPDCSKRRRRHENQRCYRCQYCGSIYASVRGSRGVCCFHCRDTHGRNQASSPPRPCDGCGNAFKAITSERYCSTECKSTSRHKLVKCLYADCGKAFTVNNGIRHGNARFCDDRCRRAHRSSERRQEWREMTPHKRRDQRLRTLYGVSLEWHDAKLAEQGGRCGNKGCGRTEAGGRWNTWHVDHCHETGVVRGLLCDPCNKALGLLRDTPEVIAGLAQYAKQHNQLQLIAN